MTFRVLTELQEKSRNVAHTSRNIHSVEINGSDQLDRSWKWNAGTAGLQPERNCGRIWIGTGYGWMTDDGSWLTDENQSSSLVW